MRITFKSLNRHMQNTIVDRYRNLAKLQEQLSTGRRILRPSDDPIDVANDIKLRAKLRQLDQYHRNIDDGMAFMSVTDTSMLSMNDLLQRVRELAVEAAPDTLSGTERGYIASEVEQLIRQIIALANSNYKGDYVFSGTQTKIPPLPMESSVANTPQDYLDRQMAYYDGSGGVGTAYQLYDPVTGDAIKRIIPGTFELNVGATRYIEGTDFTIDYANGAITPLNAALAVDVSEGGLFEAGPLGRYSSAGFSITFEHVARGRDIYDDPVVFAGDILREIETGITMPINTTVGNMFDDLDTGINLLDTLITFGQDLVQNNRSQMQTAIGNIDIGFRTLLAAQSRNGARVNRFETTRDRNERQNSEATRLLSQLEDADFAETAMNFSLAETTYNAALKSGAHIIQQSLVNFL